MDSIETLKYILKSGRSFVRFGDGELDIIFGNKPPQYQENAPMLASDLRQILTQPKDGLLICIPEVFNLKKMALSNDESKYFWKRFLLVNRLQLLRIRVSNYKYGSSQITRPYLRQKDKSVSSQIFQLFKELFSNQNLVIVEGEKTRFGVGNDLVAGALV